MNCPSANELNRFYDGELGTAEAGAVAQHVQECPLCAREVEELRALSRMLQSAQVPQVTAEVMQRLHRIADSTQERGILRIAEVLSGVAAAVLLIGLMLLVQERPQTAYAPAPWEQAGLALQRSPGEPAAETIETATWMVGGLEQGQGR